MGFQENERNPKTFNWLEKSRLELGKIAESCLDIWSPENAEGESNQKTRMLQDGSLYWVCLG